MNESPANHAVRLHDESFVIDAQLHLTYEVANRRDRGQSRVIENKYLPQFNKGGFDLIVSSIFILDFFLPEMGLR